MTGRRHVTWHSCHSLRMNPGRRPEILCEEERKEKQTMTWHLFGVVLTHQNTAANNRGENRDTTTTLQKILRNGDQFTTVSAEAIRHGLREVWQMEGRVLNRMLPPLPENREPFEDRTFNNWSRYLDDDIL